MMPATLALIRVTFDDERERNLAIAVWGSLSVVGAALGPIVGGLLLSHFWWGSVFLINVPVVVLPLLARWSSRQRCCRTGQALGSAVVGACAGHTVWTHRGHQGSRACRAVLASDIRGAGCRCRRWLVVRAAPGPPAASTARFCDLPQPSLYGWCAGSSLRHVCHRRHATGHNPALPTCGRFHPAAGGSIGICRRARLFAHRVTGWCLPA